MNVSEYRWERDQSRRAASEKFGLDPGARDFDIQLLHAKQRLLPCRECGRDVERNNPFTCDPCVERLKAEKIREDELLHARWEARKCRDQAVSRALAGLSPERRRMVGMSGVSFDSPEAVFAEGHGEW